VPPDFRVTSVAAPIHAPGGGDDSDQEGWTRIVSDAATTLESEPAMIGTCERLRPPRRVTAIGHEVVDHVGLATDVQGLPVSGVTLRGKRSAIVSLSGTIDDVGTQLRMGLVFG
jgi:hypothetical protein